MKKRLNIYLHIINSLIFITIGIIFIVKRNNMFNITIKMIGVLLLITTIIKIISLIMKKRKILTKSLDISITLITGILFLTLPTLFISIFTSIFGLYALLQGLSNIINLIIYKQDKIKGIIFIIIKTIISFTTTWLLLFSPIKNSKYLCIIAGTYIILYGVNIAINVFDKKNKLVVPLPVIFTMFLPKLLIRKINKNINYKEINKNETTNLEILIHLANKGSASMGHVEIGINNKIYSYACYNYMNRRLFGGVGDGILGVFDHNKYIKYCVNKKDRFILSYGIKLTDSELEKVNKYIEKLINTNTTRWYPEASLLSKKEAKKRNFKEMANQIYLTCDGIFYKFTKGKYKTFFVFRTNCVETVMAILGSTGNKLMNIEGVISPGTYYTYLENEYKKKNSNVISKTLYTKEYIKDNNY